MAIETIDVFQGAEKGEPGIDIAKNATVYSKVFNLRKLSWSGTDMEVGFMVKADAATTSTSVTISFAGSFDGKNFNSDVAIITTTDISDGNPDYGSFNIGVPYPFGRIKAVENNVNPVVDLQVVLAIPTSGV